jgi:hypothetical protein
MSPFAGTYAWVPLVPPTTIPFTDHWYEGAPPPFNGAAVNVTGVDVAQILRPVLADTLTEGTTTGAGFMLTKTTVVFAEQPKVLVSKA